MIDTTVDYLNAVSASVRYVKARVELYEGSTLVTTYTQDDALASIDIERVGEGSKFFGFGVTHKFNLKLIDINRSINISTDNNFKVFLGVVLPDETIEYKAFPKANVTEVNRDENTNGLSITAYDILDGATSFTMSDLELDRPYTIRDVVRAAGAKIGASDVYIPADLTEFDLIYPNGANFEGTELLSDVLTDAAEATQTIYFINNKDELVFKRLDRTGAAARIISKEDYLTLDSKTNKRLSSICNATELGDNVSASIPLVGSTQYVRDNAFWELRDDIDTLVNNALIALGGMTINQFDCSWRGDMSLEPGDKIDLVTKDNATVHSYLLNDTLSYDGTLSEKTSWSYTNENETESNPSSLGDVLKQTYAKVDKVNKEITLMASEVDANAEAISSIKVNTDSIAASVTSIEQATNESLATLNNEIGTLTNRVDASITPEDVQLQITQELENGATKVTTTTGFTFNDEGLTVEKTGSEMKTQITEDGMSVYRNNDEVLTANNTGVVAYNLHSRTFLIIGQSSRLEDYERNGKMRTGCFWIGETEVD